MQLTLMCCGRNKNCRLRFDFSMRSLSVTVIFTKCIDTLVSVCQCSITCVCCMLKYLSYTYQTLRADAEQCKVLQQLTTYSSTPHLTRTHMVQLLYIIILIILLICSTGQGRLFHGHPPWTVWEQRESRKSPDPHTDAGRPVGLRYTTHTVAPSLSPLTFLQFKHSLIQ